MDDLVLNVRQVYQYPLQTTAGPGDVVLLQQSGPQNNSAGPYGSMNILDIVTQARLTGGPIGLQSSDIIQWSPGPTIAFDGTSLNITGAPVTVTTLNASSISSAGDVFANGIALANQDWVTALFNSVVDSSVWTVNGRKGNVVLDANDIRKAGGAPINSPRFSGIVLAPTPWDMRQCDERVATTEWVQQLISCRAFQLTTQAINNAYANSPPGVWPLAPSPALGDASGRIATTLFVDESLDDLRSWTEQTIQGELQVRGYAPLNSPQFTGIPTAPTAAVGSTSGQIATTAYVMNAVTESTTGVASFNGRTGAVTLAETDVTDVGGALTASPAFTGVPTAPTATVGNNSTQIATCAFVMSEVSAATAGVSSFNGRTGDITLTVADVTGAGGAPINAPTFTGVPTAPTPAPGTNNTQIATAAFVMANGGVTSFNGRLGNVNLLANDVSAVGGALLASPSFVGAPSAPTPPTSDNSTALATTAWVNSKIATAGGVSTFNGRAGAVTLTAADVTAATGGGPVKLATNNVTNSARCVFQLPSTYKRFEIWFDGMVALTSAGVGGVQISSNGGTSWDQAANYNWNLLYMQGGAGAGAGGSGVGVNMASMFGNLDMSAVAGMAGNGRISFQVTGAGKFAGYSEVQVQTSAGVTYGMWTGFSNPITLNANAISLIMAVGNITVNATLFGYPS